MVTGQPHDETVYLSHAAIYLPRAGTTKPFEMVSRLPTIRKSCLEGDFASAGRQIAQARDAFDYHDQRDPFIGAFQLRIRQSQSIVSAYQRSVDFESAETRVEWTDQLGSWQRRLFASRADELMVLHLTGDGPVSAEFAMEQIAPTQDSEKKLIAQGVRSFEQGVRSDHLYYRTLFANANPDNRLQGYEGVGRVIARGGQTDLTATGISVKNANDIVVLIAISPLEPGTLNESNLQSMVDRLSSIPSDYDALVAKHSAIHAPLMTRVSLTLDADEGDRLKSAELLNQEALTSTAPLAKIERAFDSGRYNIICSTGFNPPNLQGLWSGTWATPWSGDFTVNGNMPCATSFMMMGNTPELMSSIFRFYESRLPGFRADAQAFYGVRGFRVPCHITTGSRESDFIPAYPHNYSHAAAPWAMAFYYDYYLYTGDKKFLAQRAYPLMKEACAYFEDFLTITDANGKAVFVPSYSPENAPTSDKLPGTAINATMDVAAAKQLLTNSIAAARSLKRDPELQKKWGTLIQRLPSYEVGADGSFREWLWPGLAEGNAHRHASHLYPLFDNRPSEIANNPLLVNAVKHTVAERLKFREHATGMAFGVVQIGLAATRVDDSSLAETTINTLAKGYWTDGMGSFHDWLNLFNMDISGGFPYLCSSSLVYAEPGTIRVLPAKPAAWKKGALRGVRLRGAITLVELSWDLDQIKCVLASDIDQTVRIELPSGLVTKARLSRSRSKILQFKLPPV